MLIAAIKSGHSIKLLSISAVQGIVSLFAVNTLGMLTGVSIGINAVSLFISCIGGISGVIMLLLMKLIFFI